MGARVSRARAGHHVDKGQGHGAADRCPRRDVQLLVHPGQQAELCQLHAGQCRNGHVYDGLQAGNRYMLIE